MFTNNEVLHAQRITILSKTQLPFSLLLYPAPPFVQLLSTQPPGAFGKGRGKEQGRERESKCKVKGMGARLIV